jgi:hypothetical protein
MVIHGVHTDACRLKCLLVATIGLGLVAGAVGTFVAAVVLEHESIFTAAIIAAYCSYLTFSALQCAVEGTGVLFSVLSAVFQLGAILYSTFTSASSAIEVLALDSCGCHYRGPSFSLSFFHSFLGLGSMYALELVTNWSDGDVADGGRWAMDRGTIARWVNIAVSWATQILYALTLFAPKMCPTRFEEEIGF